MRPYVNPARAGFLLGVVLLASFVLAGRGLGASGAFAAAAGRVIDGMGGLPPGTTPALADRMPSGVTLLDDWLVLELIGVVLGGMLSAALAQRLAWREARPGTGRLLRALLGGALMGLGARLAYGCTSGLALSGGALLATGAWVFIPIAFGTAMLVTRLARRAEV
jgi:uncharacterized membrane protein YedE/YeeE